MLVDFSAKPGFSYSQIIVNPIFQPSNMLQDSPSLIQYAAYFGSIRCFKTLLLNNADLSYKARYNQTISDYAVAGGNLEIIRILAQQQIEVNSLETSIELKQDEIFDWIVENLKIDENTLPKEILNQILLFSASYNNSTVFLKALEMGCDLYVTQSSMSVIHNAIIYKNIELCEILLNSSDFDITKISFDIIDPINIAITNNCTDVVAAFMNHPNIDKKKWDIKGEYYKTALDTGNQNIIKLFKK